MTLVLLGNSLHLILLGVLLSHFGDFVSSPTWHTSGRLSRGITIGVALLTMAIGGLQIRDIVQLDDERGEGRTTPRLQAVEPVLVGLVCSAVQASMLWRVVKVILVTKKPRK